MEVYGCWHSLSLRSVNDKTVSMSKSSLISQVFYCIRVIATHTHTYTYTTNGNDSVENKCHPDKCDSFNSNEVAGENDVLSVWKDVEDA